MSREKVTAEERIEAAKACVEGRMSQSEAARQLGVDWIRIHEWVARYKSQGEMAFRKQGICPDKYKKCLVRAAPPLPFLAHFLCGGASFGCLLSMTFIGRAHFRSGLFLLRYREVFRQHI